MLAKIVAHKWAAQSIKPREIRAREEGDLAEEGEDVGNGGDAIAAFRGMSGDRSGGSRVHDARARRVGRLMCTAGTRY